MLLFGHLLVSKSCECFRVATSPYDFMLSFSAQEPVKLEEFQSIAGLLRIIETELLHLRNVSKDKETKHHLKKVI